MTNATKSVVAARAWVALCVIALCGCAPTRSLDQRADWGSLLEEASLQVLQDSLSRSVTSMPTLISEIHIVMPESGTVSPPSSILMRDGIIVAINPTDVPDDVMHVEGQGRFAVPGLCDMHVHRLTSTAQPLLNLLFGVTCVRDMDGFSWMLAAREQMRNGNRLEPRAWIAGPILTDYPMGWYSMVVERDGEIRAAVRSTAAAGYDFVKLHNSMRPERARIVFEEAERVGIPVVGHTPHRTPLAEMAARARTIEHLKGYLTEPALEVTEEDWEHITVETDVFNTPTLYTSRSLTERISQTQSLVPASEMRRWRARANEEGPSPVHIAAARRAREMTARLIALDTPLLAGTDTGGGMPNLVYGEGLHDEIALFDSLGMTPARALSSATWTAAKALDATGEIGTLSVGAYADLMLVDSNPLLELESLRRPSLVCVSGRCLQASDLDHLRSGLSDIFRAAEERGEAPATTAEFRWWLDTTRRLHARGYLFRDTYLESAALALEYGGRALTDDHTHLAAEIRAMKTASGFSFSTSHDELE